MSRALIVINSAADRDRCIAWANKAPWGTRVEWKAAKRTLDQNSLFWAILTDVASQIEHAGNKYSTEEWKLLFMHAWGREVRFLPGLDQKSVVPVGQSSSDLSKDEMTELIEFIFAWGAEHGVVFHNESASGGGPGEDAVTPAAPASASSPSNFGGIA